MKLETWYRCDEPDPSPVVFTEPWRFGVLFGPSRVNGDIHDTCNLEQISQDMNGKGRVSKFFLHDGLRFISSGGAFNYSGGDSDCYELVEVTPGLVLPKRRRYCYTGTAVTLQGRLHVMCRPRTFRSRPLTPDEWVWHLRCMFAYGGYFARIYDGKPKAYRLFLQKEFTKYTECYSEKEKADENHRNEHIAVQREMVEIEAGTIPTTADALAKIVVAQDPLWKNKPWTKPLPKLSKQVKLVGDADDFLADLLASI